MKITFFIIATIASAGLIVLNEKNKIKSKRLKHAMESRKQMINIINEIESLNDVDIQLTKSIVSLIDNNMNCNVIPQKINDAKFLMKEKDLKLLLPNSFKIFITYTASLTQFYNEFLIEISDLKLLSKDLVESIYVDNKTLINSVNLLPFTYEDSNGGYWCFLISQNSKNNEYPVIYYSGITNKLHYQLNSFTEWLSNLTQEKQEVIRTLDNKNILNLG